MRKQKSRQGGRIRGPRTGSWSWQAGPVVRGLRGASRYCRAAQKRANRAAREE